MSFQNRNNFLWRPNDNSSITKARYKLEAEHWLNAFNSVSVMTTGGLSELFGIIGITISLFVNLILFVFFAIIAIYKLIFPVKK